MSFKYCGQCGSKNEYLAIEPKFCSSCGASLSSGLSESKSLKPASFSQKKAKILNEDETDSSFVPSISRLQYDVAPFEQKTFKVEDLLKINNNEQPEEEG